MIRHGFKYEVLARIQLTIAEATLLKKCCADHYDAVCKGAGVNGVVNALYNCADPDHPSVHPCSMRDVDTILKIMEQPPYPCSDADKSMLLDLRAFFKKVFYDMSDKWVEMNP